MSSETREPTDRYDDCTGVGQECGTPKTRGNFVSRGLSESRGKGPLGVLGSENRGEGWDYVRQRPTRRRGDPVDGLLSGDGGQTEDTVGPLPRNGDDVDGTGGVPPRPSEGTGRIGSLGTVSGSDRTGDRGTRVGHAGSSVKRKDLWRTWGRGPGTCTGVRFSRLFYDFPFETVLGYGSGPLRPGLIFWDFTRGVPSTSGGCVGDGVLLRR